MTKFELSGQLMTDPLASFNLERYEPLSGDFIKPKKVLTNLKASRILRPVIKLKKDDTMARSKTNNTRLKFLLTAGVLAVAAAIGIASLLGDKPADYVVAVVLSALLFLDVSGIEI